MRMARVTQSYLRLRGRLGSFWEEKYYAYTYIRKGKREGELEIWAKYVHFSSFSPPFIYFYITTESTRLHFFLIFTIFGA